MYINTHVRTAQIVNDGRAYHFHHSSPLCAGENSVHIKVKHRYAPCNTVDTHRVKCRIDINNAVKLFDMLINIASDHVGKILTLQLIAVGACYKADSGLAFAVLYAALLYI